MDGISVPGAKRNTYRVVDKSQPDYVHPGFELFYTEDKKSGRLMSPKEVFALHPRPEYIWYE